MTWTAVFPIAVLGLFLWTGRKLVRNPHLRTDYQDVLKSIRWWMIPAGLILLAATIAVTAVLIVAIPVTSWGWWKLISGHNSNLIIGDLNNSPDHTSPATVILVTTILVLIVVLIPLIALWEEETYRGNLHHHSWPRRIRATLWFGCIHLTMGIPVATALAIGIVAGHGYLAAYLWRTRYVHRQLQQVYPPMDIKLVDYTANRMGELHSAALHAVYNWWAIATIAVVLIAAT